jgi:hypothetical protein
MDDRDINEHLQKIMAFVDEMLQETIDSFAEIWEQLQEFIYDFDEEIPKTPYSFNSKVRIYDKRPHKQHRIRNNCRKERYINVRDSTRRKEVFI